MRRGPRWLGSQKQFLNRVYDGEFNLMLAGFLNSRSLSKKDIAELKRILDKGKDYRCNL
jgi:predicted transcriptional regulator